MSDSESTGKPAANVRVDAPPAAPGASPAAAPIPAPEKAANAPSGAAQAGALLRQLRQSAGMNPVLLASALKVTPQKIQALEEGRLDELPDLTFARGLAAAVCRVIGADPVPVLAQMPSAAPALGKGALPGAGAQREPVQPSAAFSASEGGESSGSSRWLLAAAVVLLGALAVWFVPWDRLNIHALDAIVNPPQTTAPAEPAASEASAAADAASAPVLAASPASIQVPQPVANAISRPTPVLPASARERASAPKPAASAASAPASAAHRGSGIVEQDVVSLSATGRSWVQVRDGNGKVVFNHVMQDGDTSSVGGEMPLSVTVGDKDAVSVAVRGQSVNLDEHTRKGGHVARLKVDSAQEQP